MIVRLVWPELMTSEVTGNITVGFFLYITTCKYDINKRYVTFTLNFCCDYYGHRREQSAAICFEDYQ